MSSSQSSLTRRSVSSRQNFGDGANNKVDDTLYTRGGDAASDFAIPRVPSQLYGKNDGSDNGSPFSIFGTNVTTAILPSWTGLFVKSFLGMTVALYVLNQKHMLPKPLAAIVSKALFWPTLPITASRRIGTWTTVVDETVMIGGAPIGFAGIPERLYEDYGVRIHHDAIITTQSFCSGGTVLLLLAHSFAHSCFVGEGRCKHVQRIPWANKALQEARHDRTVATDSRSFRALCTRFEGKRQTICCTY